MTRNYPFNLINNDNTVDIKTATSIALKFLIQNKCLGDYVIAWRNEHKDTVPSESPKDTAKYAIRRTIDILRYRGIHLGLFFSSSIASFTWRIAERELGQDVIMWHRLSIKWEREVGQGVKITI